ncbi:FeoA domain protein [Rosistilla carotiformis]|uniref:FeoA domain protein n=1 Tax=Rosistilla carotiformis TaxID=2528017 RepID=A0A518JWT4_9BACT|nr:FeoA family protein [Rosistilla carotiformis]QDV69999.1 FeoA domain protein [Rosistilla carotiformis]
MHARSLADLPANSSGMVLRFNLSDEDSIRIRTLGICPGMTVEVVQNGDPLILASAGTRIGISRRIAAHVMIEDEPVAAGAAL